MNKRPFHVAVFRAWRRFAQGCGMAATLVAGDAPLLRCINAVLAKRRAGLLG